MLAVAAEPALADVVGADLPDFALEEDGTVVIDGDLATDCPSFAVGLEEGYESRGDPEQAQSVLEQCRRGGFLPSGGSAPVSRTPHSPSAHVSEQHRQPSPARAVLPSTGGPNLPMIPAPMGGALLMGLVALRLAARPCRYP